jgi:chromatin segregation and condensation protein Rec8/ScpA/Scc1 (kleisin family)
MLELIRLKQLRVRQESMCAEIWIDRIGIVELSLL